MKTLKKLILTCVLVPLLVSSMVTAQVQEKDYTYGIKINGVLCGYADIHLSTMEKEGKEYTLLKQEMFLMLSVLGFEVNQRTDMTYHIDPATGQFTYFDSHLQKGDQDLTSRVVIEGDVAHCVSFLDDEPKKVALPAGVILPNTLIFSYLKKDFLDEGAEEKAYDIFMVQESVIHKVTYRRTGTEKLEIAGKTHEAVILDELDQVTGVKLRLWLDKANGMILKLVEPNGMVAYLADRSIKKEIEVANYDEKIVTKTNVTIVDVRNISYLKVKATMEPTGEWLKPEDLNIPGQRFEGTVKENRIEGFFEIEHVRYDGAKAPPYPPSFRDDKSLKKYLDPQELIESDDPVLIKKAQELAEGSKDSWEAACRLSQWVADNITYEIPGGGAARKTYDMRAGECGAHSLLLAAFCRVVGIPARVVWGCVYTPNFGGAFGQHGWNEVYMGEAGWIPVDSTGLEVDFVDSGHIRLGIFQQGLGRKVNSKSMEILDYRIRSGAKSGAGEAAAGKYAPYVGEYNHPGGGKPFKVKIQDGHLAIDIPNSATVLLKDPDEKGNWFCTLTKNLYCNFARDGDGKVVEMKIHEIVRLRRKSEPEEVGDDVPEALRPYLGGYFLSALKVEFTVLWDNGKLAFRHPIKKIVIHLRPAGEDGYWVGEFGQYTISFDKSEEGKVIMLIIDSGSSFRRR